MDLAAQKKARAERMQAKRDSIKAQNESVAESESEAVAEKTPEANEEDTKKDDK